MKRIVLVVDSLDWAFANIARQIQKHFGDRYEITIVADLRAPIECDVALVFWWKSSLRLRHLIRTKRLAVGLYDHWSWRSHDDAMHFAQAVDAADVVFCGNEQLRAIVADMEAKQVVLSEDGVDTSLFTPQPQPAAFTIGWAGNRVYEQLGLGDIKGVHLVEKAWTFLGCPLVIADKQQGRIPFARMPEDFYGKISCYVCASLFEGTPNPVLEALACGRPVVSTDVGIVTKAVRSGHSGFIVQRSVESMVYAIRRIKNGELNWSAQQIAASVADWDWAKKVRAFEAVLEA